MKVTRAAVPPSCQHLVGVQAWTLDECFVLVSIDAGRYHMSISHPARYPSWDEIKTARYQFLPLAKWFSMLLPPPQHYINLHPNCFHLWKTTDRALEVINPL